MFFLYLCGFWKTDEEGKIANLHQKCRFFLCISKDYSIFSYHLVPTYELRQEILSHGANVEVVCPEILRAQIKEEIAEMHKIYK